jgi:predicted pyridoxine 5'-phosphate oxidase superfamily flavin-nucleotide-binding protein
VTNLCRSSPQSCPIQQARPYYREQQQNTIFVPADSGSEEIQRMNNFERVFTPAARQAQAERGSSKAYERRIAEGFPDRVTPELAAFIAEQDTAFLATATADGAPYIQHRGGPKGFIKVIDDRTLGFADYRGNRQYITLANLSENDRAYLFLLDRARVIENDPALVEQLFDQGYKARPERAILFTIEAWDVNCSSHIVTRFTEAEVEEAFSAVQAKVADLQAENARLRAALAVHDGKKVVLEGDR